eukprot:scaffold33413_cov35-Prasinocladus_malaysianus.AAC.1
MTASNSNATLQYRWLGELGASPEATVTIDVELVLKPPDLQEPVLSTTEDGGILIQLKSESKAWMTTDGSNRTNLYRIHKAPRFGTLYQVGQDAGEAISAYGDSQPVIRQFADRVPPYSPELGPAFSSTFGACPRCCPTPDVCTPKNCADKGYPDFTVCEADLSLDNLLGPTPREWPNVKFETSEPVPAWLPAEPSAGNEWFVVGFPQPVHATAVEVAELQNPGTIVKISVATKYAGNNTEWVTVWTGAPEEDVPNAPRTFSPAICPAFDVLTQWVRVDLATDAVQGYQWVVAVTLLGTTEDQNDWVLSPDGGLMYTPTPGVTLLEESEIEDSFDVVVMDCSTDEGAPAPVVIPGDLRKAVIESSTTLEKDFELQIVRSACFLMESDVGDGSFPKSDSKNLTFESCKAIDLEDKASEQVIALDSSLGKVWLQPVNQLITDYNLTAVAVSRGVRYALRLHVTVLCPAGASDSECANSAEDCMMTDDNQAAQFDPALRACVPVLSESPTFKLTIVLVLCIGAVILLVSIGGLAIVIRHKVAKDIAVHHSILRKKLGQHNGYEIATEGDSFKCAFRTPEDAILWGLFCALSTLQRKLAIAAVRDESAFLCALHLLSNLMFVPLAAAGSSPGSLDPGAGGRRRY